jgi:hypothetical protein
MSYTKILESNNTRVLRYLTARDPNNKQKKKQLQYYTTVARYQVRGDEVNVLASRNQRSVAGSSINLFRTLFVFINIYSRDIPLRPTTTIL